jgi:mRNA interferase MazF
MSVSPKRGEIWLINWNPGRGSEQNGIRPAVVIQNDIGNEKAATTIVAAISSTVKNYPMNVVISPPEGGLKVASIIKTSQLMTISKERLFKKLGQISNETQSMLDRAIKLSLSL